MTERIVNAHDHTLSVVALLDRADDQFTRFNLAALLCVRQRPTLESLSGLVLVAAKYILVLREPMKEGAKGEDAGLAL